MREKDRNIFVGEKGGIQFHLFEEDKTWTIPSTVVINSTDGRIMRRLSKKDVQRLIKFLTRVEPLMHDAKEVQS